MQIKQIIKYIIRKVQFFITDLLYPNAIKLFWFRGKHNFGDAINPLLLEIFTNRKVVWIEPEFYGKTNYLAIGSILERASSNTIVWGSGFISEKGKCIKAPQQICAVRGPLTRDLLLKRNIECPEIYGDPALLLPRVYHPKIEQKYELGIIPHFVDKDNTFLQKFKSQKNIKVLDIQMSDPYTFIDELLSCKKIASSSLHGVIVADAYNIPSLWIEFSDKVIGKGFKFLDYFASVGRIDTKALKIDDNTDIGNLYNAFYEYEIEIDLEILMNVFPLKVV